MKQTNIVVGLDIGTTKICAIVGTRNEYGKVEVLGMGKAESLGVSRGVVSNIDKTVNSIQEAVHQASEASRVNIANVMVGIAGQHIQSLQHRGMITRTNPESEIRLADIRKLIDDMSRLAMRPGYEIIDIIPQEFTVDDETGIKDPVGMSGVRLESSFHIITGQTTAAQNIYRCVKKAGLEVDNLVLEPIASSEAVLADEEKEAGVALVDIGGGTTDIALFYDGIIRHTAVIPFGGNIITEDIREGCNLMRQQAELLKLRFGSALATETNVKEIVSIPGLRGRDPKEVSVTMLAQIIQSRMEEIIELVQYEIRNSGFERKLSAGIVLTGGGALLRDLKHLVELKTGFDVRIGTPNEHLARGSNEIKSPMYATCIGLVIRGLKALENTDPAETQTKSAKDPNAPTLITRFLGGIKNWFEDADETNKDFKE